MDLKHRMIVTLLGTNIVMTMLKVVVGSDSSEDYLNSTDEGTDMEEDNKEVEKEKKGKRRQNEK